MFKSQIQGSSDPSPVNRAFYPTGQPPYLTAACPVPRPATFAQKPRRTTCWGNRTWKWPTVAQFWDEQQQGKKPPPSPGQSRSVPRGAQRFPVWRLLFSCVERGRKFPLHTMHNERSLLPPPSSLFLQAPTLQPSKKGVLIILFALFCNISSKLFPWGLATRQIGRKLD